jgi:hypothetical protein
LSHFEGCKVGKSIWFGVNPEKIYQQHNGSSRNEQSGNMNSFMSGLWNKTKLMYKTLFSKPPAPKATLLKNIFVNAILCRLTSSSVKVKYINPRFQPEN